MNYSIYIYYKVTPQNENAVRAAAHDLIAAIARSSGIAGRLLCRRDKPDTWMEAYEGVADPETFLAAIDNELVRVRFADLLGPDARRVTELFRPL